MSLSKPHINVLKASCVCRYVELCSFAIFGIFEVNKYCQFWKYLEIIILARSDSSFLQQIYPFIAIFGNNVQPFLAVSGNLCHEAIGNFWQLSEAEFYQK